MSFDWTRENFAGLAYGTYLIARPTEHASNLPIGLALSIVMLPVAVLSVPADLVAMAFRRKKQVHGVLNGKVVDNAGTPVSGYKVTGKSNSKRRQCGGPIGISCTDKDFEQFQFEAETDMKGEFSIPFEGTIGVRDRFSILLNPSRVIEIISEKDGTLAAREGQKKIGQLTLSAGNER